MINDLRQKIEVFESRLFEIEQSQAPLDAKDRPLTATAYKQGFTGDNSRLRSHGKSIMPESKVELILPPIRHSNTISNAHNRIWHNNSSISNTYNQMVNEIDRQRMPKDEVKSINAIMKNEMSYMKVDSKVARKINDQENINLNKKNSAESPRFEQINDPLNDLAAYDPEEDDLNDSNSDANQRNSELNMSHFHSILKK